MIISNKAISNSNRNRKHQHKKLLTHCTSLAASSSSSSSSSISLTASTISSNNNSSKNTLSVFLAVTYMSIIVSVMSLPSALSTISFPNTDPSSFSFIMAVATLFIMLGKFILGGPTDKIGGENVLLLSCASIAAIVYGCGIATNVKVFGFLWILLNFAFSATWGSVGQSIRNNFPQDEWGSQLSVIAAGSRLGSVGAALFYGKVLEYGKDWRLVFKAASVVQIIAFLMALFLKNSFKSNNIVASNTSTATLKEAENESINDVMVRVSKSSVFWLMLIGKVALMVVGQFISFIPLFLITGLKMENHKAASASSVFSLGSLVASILGAQIYKNLQRTQQVDLVLGVNVISSIVGIFLAMQTLGGLQIPLIYSLSSLFIWGATWALAFYTPPGVVALELGGRQHAALLTNVFDAAGYLAAAIFSYYASELGKIGKWTGILSSLTLCSLTASWTMLLAMKIPSKTR